MALTPADRRFKKAWPVIWSVAALASTYVYEAARVALSSRCLVRVAAADSMLSSSPRFFAVIVSRTSLTERPFLPLTMLSGASPGLLRCILTQSTANPAPTATSRSAEAKSLEITVLLQ